VLAERLHDLLNDGTGRIRPELVPFAEGFCRMERARSGLTWIANHHVHRMLRTLADPNTPITHETLNDLSPWRSVAYPQDLLMLHGVLPPVHRQLTLFQRWLDDTLARIDQREHLVHRLHRPSPHPRLLALGDEQQAPAPVDGAAPEHR
jgi:hypothetical protein